MASKTLKFLPTIFQTDANEKFLSATMDQLVSEPNLRKIYGYIGRTFAPTYKPTDSYIVEPTSNRQNYQLEPSVIVKNTSNDITFYSSYLDLLNKIDYYGGKVDDHSRLFDNEYYSFDPLIDYDKFVNFSQYYWLPNGLDPVDVYTGGVEFTKTYDVARNTKLNIYEFTANSTANPTIILARGGTYVFKVNQLGNPFWIQTELGLDGRLNQSQNIGVRDILGVVNNGLDVGDIVFTVPQKSAQDRFLQMDVTANVDFTTTVAYNKIQGKLLSEFYGSTGGFDGVASQLDGKTFVFVDQDKLQNHFTYSIDDPNIYDEAWTVKGKIDIDDWDEIPWAGVPDVWDRTQFELGKTIAEEDRVSVWTIKLIPASNLLTFSGLISAKAGDRIIQQLSGASAIVLEAVTNSNVVKVEYENAQIFIAGAGPVRIDGVTQTAYPTISPENDYLISISNLDSNSDVRRININEKVFVKSGFVNANKQYYKDYDGSLKVVPLITSNLDTLYYQDGTSSRIYGEIKIVDIQQWNIDIENDILGKKKYTSPNGIVFTNGLKIKFGTDVIPSFYQNKQFYIEGVGSSITLTDVSLMVTPELYNTEISSSSDGKIYPDYIVINRGSSDLNPWSRNNHWFHRDIISLTNEYNTPTQPVNYDQNLRALRPIIEFDPNIKLYNNGTSGKIPVDIFDSTTEDAFNSIHGQNLLNINGVDIVDGLRIIFSNDRDPLVKDNIYTINIIYTQINTNNDPIHPQINLVKAADGDTQEYDTVVIVNGSEKGNSFWYNGVSWVLAQQKTGIQQSPLFDVFDNSGNSFDTYAHSSFKGTKIFGYKIASAGVIDTVLSFPLSYRNFSTQGEIEFQNYFDTDSFNYEYDTKIATVDINTGVLFQYNGRTEYTKRNIWSTVVEPSKQYQKITYTYSSSNVFTLPITVSSNEATIPYIKVYINNKFVPVQNWTIDALALTISEPIQVGDIIDVLIYSKEVSSTQYYQVPLNLDYNAQNLDFTSLTLGQIRNHVIELTRNSTEVFGHAIGSNNLRDLSYKKQGGNILQHSAPTSYASLFLIDDTINFVDSVKFAQREYSKFKNKFLELSIAIPGINPVDASASVDLILTTINSFKNKTFSWYYSDMIPYGNDTNIIDIEVFDPLNRSYEITNVFDDTILSNKAILVYLDSDPSAVYVEGTGIDVDFNILNKSQYVTPQGLIFEDGLKVRFGSGVTPERYRNKTFEVTGVGYAITLIAINRVQLVKGKDYTFDQRRPAITLTDNVYLDVGYRITVVEYSNTDGNYIPETPTKLGLYPKFIPQILEDDTYLVTTNVIVGHDGSKTPVFNDYRDQFLLELERRIYNNIKIDYNKNVFDIYQVIPGKFRNNDYTRGEFVDMISSGFLNWVGDNNLDYTTNSAFSGNDGFTWNYSKCSDVIDGEKLPGGWRAIFKYFYDTDTPHQTPWEMLGFSEKPDWWENYYGPAPYTGGNALLWEHLSEGRIVDGPRAGIDSKFVRPNLTSIIPVDVNGLLRFPAEFLTTPFNSKLASSSWAVGDQGPAESAWVRSSDYPYTLQIAMALSKPAKYFGSQIDTKNYIHDASLNQYVYYNDKHHIKQQDILVNGSAINGVTIRTSGYLNWIADYLTNQAIDSYTKLKDFIINYQVNLSYKLAGFTDQKYLDIFAEQYSPTSTNDSVIMPDENYSVYLNKSTPLQRIVYSAVIVEKTANGFSVRGYNLQDPFFTIIPSIVNNNASKITVLTETAAIFHDYQPLKITVPYGYEFNSKQQLIDFLISYERYLVAQGFTFTEFEDTLALLKDWRLSAQEFLYWTQQGWPTGSILVLSPVASTLSVITNNMIVDDVSRSKVLDQSFTLVRNIDYTVMRSATNFKLTLTNTQMIGFVELNLVQYEHVLIFDNITVFNDVIYKPELGNRQFRLKLVGQKTDNWDGSLSPGGFIYNSNYVPDWSSGKDYLKGDLIRFKSFYYVALENIIATDTFNFSRWKQIDYTAIKKGMLPNFATIAGWPTGYYDNYNESVDSNNTSYVGGKNSNQSHYGYALIGFKSRNYLHELGLTDSTQVDLYKGFIKEKGTINAVNALTTAKFNNSTSTIDFYEEWAIRVGEYGALDINPFIEVVLDEKAFSMPLQVLTFISDENNNLSDGITSFSSKDLYKSSYQYNATIALNRDKFTNYENDIPYAGFVNVNDVDTTIFDINNYIDLDSKIEKMASGYTIWCAKDFDSRWNVYRITETNNTITSISNSLDNFVSVSCRDFHNLNAGDVILIKNFSSTFDGFYQVHSIVDLTTILVKFGQLQSNFTSFAGEGILYVLKSLRFEYMEQVRLMNPLNGWRNNEIVWVEKSDLQNKWAVFKKTDPWVYDYAIDKFSSERQPNDRFGQSLKSNSDGTIFAVGSPYNYTLSSNGTVDIFVKVPQGKFEISGSVFSINSATSSFGYAVDLTDDFLIVGAPESETNTGHVYVYLREPGRSQFNLIQILRGNSGDKFGYSVASSRDEKWLYVGAPDNNKVYAYALNNLIESQRTVLTIGPSITAPFKVTIPWIPYSAQSVIIEGPGITYVYGKDYTLLGNVITFVASSLPLHDIDVQISQQPNYTLVEEIDGPISITQEFGSVISSSTDGAQVIIGAPHADVTVNSQVIPTAGAAYIYNRSIESFKSFGERIFTTTNRIASVLRITVDGVEVGNYSAAIGGYIVTFTEACPIGSVVQIETNSFDILETLVGSDPQENAKFGSSVLICPYSCSVYVGAPKFTVDTRTGHQTSKFEVIPSVDVGISVNSGAVYAFYNQGRIYGTISGTVLNPIVTAGHSIRLNDFEIVFSDYTLESVVSDINSASILGITAMVSAKIDTQNYYKDSSTGDWYDQQSNLITDTLLLAVLLSYEKDQVRLNEVFYHKNNGNWYDDRNVEVTSSSFIDLLNSQCYLKIECDSTYVTNKLRVLTGVGTALDDLGLQVFTQVQTMSSPDVVRNEQFGTSLSINKESNKLVISGAYGSTLVTTTFDQVMTTFDNDSTRYEEEINSSGSVYVFESYIDPRSSIQYPNRYIYTQQLNTGDLNAGDQFGWNADIVGNYILVSAPNDSTLSANGGRVYLFENPNSVRGWDKINSQNETVDIESVSRLYLYNKVNSTIVENLQTIDPIKGKILGQAEQEITYKTSIDPAIYNKGSNASTNIIVNNCWSNIQVNTVWWNLDKVRFIDYEQGELTYRSLNWGGMFPGSVIEICEWSESDVLPSKYVTNGGDGVPLYPDDSAYVETVSVDQSVGSITIKYYFWVTDKTSLTAINSSRKLPTSIIANFIENPSAQGIPYAAILANNALCFYNISNLLSSGDIVLHIDHKHNTKDSNIIHSEFELIQNNPNNILPIKIVNKLIDSLSGINFGGQNVPDSHLTDAEKYGVLSRPRQTMIVDRLEAMNQAVVFINSVFKQYQLVDLIGETSFNVEDPIPNIKFGFWDTSINSYDEFQYLDTNLYPVGYRVLVESDLTQDGLWVIYIKNSDESWQVDRIQAYKTSLYWHTIDWYATGFDSSTSVNYIVPDNNSALTLSYVFGDVIKVTNGGNGKWRLIQVQTIDGINQFVTVGVQDGTIAINPSISDYTNAGLGFDNQIFGSNRYDQNPNIEMRYLLESVLFETPLWNISDYKSKITDLFYILIDYIHSEQNYVDWIFKTSFATVNHRIRELTQAINYTNDNQTYYEEYINEVKPYKTKIREYLLDYGVTDTFDGSITDFDLPPYYDYIIGTFRSPSGEIPLKDEAMWQTSQYKDWYDNRTYEIGSVVVTNSGTGYTSVPTIQILSSTGSGAEAHAVINADTGEITDIIVDKSGSGYSEQVFVRINGIGTGATAYALFKQNQIRSISTAIKFDRIGHHSSMADWTANTAYTSGDIISYNGAAYKIEQSHTSTNLIDYTKISSYGANLFVSSNLVESMGAADRMMAYYQPLANMPQIEKTVQYIVTANATVNSDIIYVNSVNKLRKGMFISGEGVKSSTIIDMVSNVALGVSYIQVDKIQSIDSPVAFVATYKNLNQLMAGVEYPGVQIIGANFDDAPGFDTGAEFSASNFDQIDYDEDGTPILGNGVIDTVIKSSYLDTELGTRAEDIIVDGGSYIDSYSSHAPEELIPGILYDTLSMQVYTTISGGTVELGHRIFVDMTGDTSYLRISNDHSTYLTKNLLITDTEIHVADASILQITRPGSGIPGVVFINNERITYFSIDLETNILSQLRRGTLGTGTPQTHFIGSTVFESGVSQQIPGIASNTITTGANVSYHVTDTPIYDLLLTTPIVLNSGDHIIQAISGANVTVVSTRSIHVETIQLSSPVTVYSGDYITQADTLTNVRVANNSINSTSILVTYNNGQFDLGSGFISINGTTANVYPVLASTRSVQHATVIYNNDYDFLYTSAVLLLSGNLTLASGDIITQSSTGTTVTVNDSVSSQNSVTVTFNGTNEFIYGANSGIILVNGVSSNVYIVSSTYNNAFDSQISINSVDVSNISVFTSNIEIPGYVYLKDYFDRQPFEREPFDWLQIDPSLSQANSISCPVTSTLISRADIYGNISIAANTSLHVESSWYNLGATTATDGLGFDAAITNPVLFLKQSPSAFLAGFEYTDEQDSLNILTTEDDKQLIAEFGDYE